MASLKVIRKRIVSVRNTQQVTKAMKMVSAAKLRRAQEAVENARTYADKLTDMLRSLAQSPGGASHPFLGPVGEAPAHVVVVTSDRGLCGGYNGNLARLAEQFLASEAGEGAVVTICGRRGRDHFKRQGVAVAAEHVNLANGMNVALARVVGSDIASRFLSAEAGSVFMVYSRFKSAISQTPVVEQLLPVVAEEADDSGATPDYIYEPNGASILASLLPRYVETKVLHAMLEATASEHGARMTAMDSASRNAGEMIDKLTLAMNRARQASITTELMEIVSGAEALKG